MNEYGTLLEMSVLSELAYNNYNADNFNNIIIDSRLNGIYTVLAKYDDTNITNSGFQGYLLKNTVEGENEPQFVFAFRGTEVPGQILKDLVITDIAYMGNSLAPQQMKDAMAFVKTQLDLRDLTSCNTIFTGHSLGGSIAGMASYVFGFDAYTYNGFGIANMLWDADDSYLDSNLNEINTDPETGQVINLRVTLGNHLETLGITVQRSSDRIINIVQDGYSRSDLVGGILTNIISNQVGETHFVLNHTGDAGGLLANHNITSLNQSIAIYNNILKLFPNEDYGSLTEAVRFFSPADKKISRMLTCLGELVGVNTTGFTDHVQASKEIAEAHGTGGALSFGLTWYRKSGHKVKSV